MTHPYSMIPTIEAFMHAHQLCDVTIVADAARPNGFNRLDWQG